MTIKEEVLKMFIVNGKCDKNKIRINHNSRNFYKEDLFERIKNNTKFLDNNSIFSERLYCIVNELNKRPICKSCGSLKINFRQYNGGYDLYCSKCKNKKSTDYLKLRIKKTNKKIQKLSMMTNINFKNLKEFDEKQEEFELNIKKLFLTARKTQTNITNLKSILNCNKKLIRFVFYRTRYLNLQSKFLERIYHIIYDLSDYPKCKICGDNMKFPYAGKTCSNKCRCILSGLSHRGKKQSKTQIKNRINGRKNNGKPWHSKETLKKIVKNMKATQSTVEYKEKMKNRRIEFGYNKKQSEKMKRLIREGKFTPCITNSWANSRVKIKINGFNTPYRSTWEAAFQILNPNYLYEKIRIPYIIDNEEHNYIVDFVDEEKKILYEIKPDSLKDNAKNILKRESALKWCQVNDFNYQLISNDWFKENAGKIDYSKYDKKLSKGMKQFLNGN